MAFLIRFALIFAAVYGIYLFLRWYDRREKEKQKNREWNEKIDQWDQDRKIRANQKEIENLKKELKDKDEEH